MGSLLSGQNRQIVKFFMLRQGASSTLSADLSGYLKYPLKGITNIL